MTNWFYEKSHSLDKARALASIDHENLVKYHLASCDSQIADAKQQLADAIKRNSNVHILLTQARVNFSILENDNVVLIDSAKKHIDELVTHQTLTSKKVEFRSNALAELSATRQKILEEMYTQQQTFF
jgi:hypothetical protein